MPVQRHVVVVPLGNGGVEVHPLKQWLSMHPDQVPAGLHPRSSTSHQLRSGLCKNGWVREDTLTEVRLFPPGSERESEIIGEVLGSGEEDEITNEVSPSFSLEYQLRDFLASNLDSIPVGGKKLQLFVDATGREGIEFPTAVGPIDILATNSDGSFFVFELKRATSSDKTVGQLARYMGWVKQTIGKGREVFGVIVAQSVNSNLRYAASIIQNVELFEYKVSFHLTPAHDITSS
jgi:endonuclease